MDDIYFRVEDDVIMSTQFDKIITTMQSNDVDSELGGTTTNNSPVPTVTPSRESSQQLKTKKKTKLKKKKKKKVGSQLVWKNYIPPSGNPFAIPSESQTNTTIPEEGNEDKELQSSVEAMNNLRIALEGEHKKHSNNNNKVYSLNQRAIDIWKLNRHFNIVKGIIPRGTSEQFSSKQKQDKYLTQNPELTRHLEILHRGNIGDVLQFTSNKYGHMDSFYQSTKHMKTRK